MKVVKHVFSILSLILVIVGVILAVFSGLLLEAFVEAKNMKAGQGTLAVIFSTLGFIILDFATIIVGTVAVIPSTINFVRFRKVGTGILFGLSSLILITGITVLVLFIVR